MASFPRTVKTISSQAFEAQAKMKTITFPNTVTSFGNGVIYDCQVNTILFEPGSRATIFSPYIFAFSGLTKVMIPASVQVIDKYAFVYTQLSTIIFEENSNLIKICEYAFSRTKIAQFNFPAKIKTIEPYIFQKADQLTKIYIPELLTNISLEAFTGCPSIEINQNNPEYSVESPATLMNKNKTIILYASPASTSMTILKSVTEISPSLLQSCTSLTNIVVDPSNTAFSALDGILYNFNKSMAIACSGGISKAVIHSSCKIIGPYCFSMITKLTSVKMSFGITSTDSFSFASISLLEDLIFPSSLQYIGDYAFDSSTFKSIIFEGNGPQDIGIYGFHSCKSNSVSFGKNMASLSDRTFKESLFTEINFNPNCALTVFPYESISYCNNLISFTIPKNIKTIGVETFTGCNNLRELIFLSGGSLTEIKNKAFAYTPIENLCLPKTLKKLEGNTWVGNWQLKSLTFEDGIELSSFGSGDFKDCVKLTTVTIPPSITSFDSSVFLGCSSLTSIHVNTLNKNYISNDGIVYTINGERLVVCPGGRIDAKILQQINIIGANAFYLCRKLSNLSFEKDCTLEFIEEGTFYSCTALTRVDLPKSLKSVERNAFAGCTKLSTITFPENSLCNLNADSIFADCTSLESIIFGKFSALTILGSNTFKGCKNIETIKVPANCTTIGQSCFDGCTSLSSVIYETDSHMMQISTNAFSGCTSLENFNIPDSFISISNDIFGNAQSIKNIFIAANLQIKSIKTNAFANTKLESITFGKGTTLSLIEDSAFMNTNIKSFNALGPVSISVNAFKNCIKLTNINISDIIQLNNFAFSNCISLTKIYLYMNCPLLGFNAFEDCTSLIEVKIESNSKFSTIGNYGFSRCSKLKNINIPRNIRAIGSFAFANCIKLENIIFEENSLIGTIGFHAFENCQSLRSFTIPDSMKVMDNSLFGYAPNINHIIIPEKMKIELIKKDAFKNIDLQYLTFGFSSIVSTIEDSCFEGKKLEKIEINITQKLGKNVFKNCKNLKTASINFISFPSVRSLHLITNDIITSIPEGTFDGCEKLKKFTSINMIESIGDFAFRGCKLLSMHIPSSVTMIGNSAFENCAKIESMPKRIKHIGNRSFVGTGIKFSIRIPMSVNYIGADAFIKTNVKNILYCGNKDFSSFNQAFPFASNILVSHTYPSSIFCSNFVKKSYYCSFDEITNLNIDDSFLYHVFMCAVYTTD